jgi:GGDEF domain-containing protein
MLLDVPTLFIVSIFVTTILGLFLLFAWVQDRSIRALAWWGAAYLIAGISVAIYTMQDSATSAFSLAIGNALLFVACGVIWSGARLFHGREVRPLWMFAGAIAWLIALTFPGFVESSAGRIVLSSVAIAAYTFLTAMELWGGRRERLLSRWPAVAVLVLQAAVFLVPIPIVLLAPGEENLADFAHGWFGIFALETLLYAIATAFIVLTMAKERSEKIHRTAATIDPLTEIFNRRALLDAGRRVLARIPWEKQPAAVLMFDLDHFKKINDRFGHAVGDRALQTFAQTLSSALVAAERVRAAFEEAAKEIDGLPVGGTVSIGAAATDEPECDIDKLLGEADKALYAAKTSGRNRVVLSGSAEEQQVPPQEAPPTGMPSEAAKTRSLVTAAPADLAGAIAAARLSFKMAG